jgi:hypothetical protein
MLKQVIKSIIFSLGISFSACTAVAGDCETRYAAPTYVVYQVPVERPQPICSTTRDYYSCTVEYRQTTEYTRTTRREERTYLTEPPVRHIRYAYVDP